VEGGGRFAELFPEIGNAIKGKAWKKKRGERKIKLEVVRRREKFFSTKMP